MEQKKKISFVFDRSKNAITFPTTGIYGGPNPDNLGITIHFITEYSSIPHSSTIEIEEGKQIDLNSGENIFRGDYTREVQATTVVTPEIAIIMAKWLEDAAKKIFDRRKGIL